MNENSSNSIDNPGTQVASLSPPARTAISLLLTGYLGVLVLGPLTNPVSSEHLTRPMVQAVAPVHRVLFLGHGYRFFSPEPGPGHFVECRFSMSDGSTITTRFPDREHHWPRLLYHRWFMLAETIFNELDGTPDAKSFEEAQTNLRHEVDQLRSLGKLKPAKLLTKRIEELNAEYERTRERIDLLLQNLANEMLDERPGATSVELVLIERSIPLPGDVADGVKLDDPRYLSEPIPIGLYTRDGLPRSSSQLEDVQ